MSQLLRRTLQVLLPLVVLAGAAGAAYVMYLNRPPVETQAPVVEPPGVRVQRVSYETTTLSISSQGTVQPRTSSQLVPEISGPVVEVARSFAVGGFFEAGDVLLRIDPYDYQQAVIAGQAQLAQAELRLAQEEAEAEVARREWNELGRGTANALTLRQPQVDDARAAVAAAEAALDRADRDLERAEIKAPYAGRVQSKDVDVGQFVTKGNPIARIYAVDSAEVRLPLPDEQLAYVNVPLSYRGSAQGEGPAVTISSNFAGQEYTWQGRIVRTESEIDPVSRMVHVVAEVEDPYAPGNDPSRPPLAAGMFVEAEIEGRAVNDVVVLPWSALRGRDQVLVVDDANRLRFRQVEVLRSTTDTVMVSGGLAEGEAVSVSTLDTVTDGMAVRIIDDGVRMAENAAPQATSPAETTRGIRAPDWRSSREEQLAFIRQQLAQQDTTTETVSSDPAPADVSGQSTPPSSGSNDRTNATFNPDPTRSAETTAAVEAPDWSSSREEQLAFVRRQLARRGVTTETAPSESSLDDLSRQSASPISPAEDRESATFALDPRQSREEQIAAVRRELARLTAASADAVATNPIPPTVASARPNRATRQPDSVVEPGRVGNARGDRDLTGREAEAGRGRPDAPSTPETSALNSSPEPAPAPEPTPTPEPAPTTASATGSAAVRQVAVLPFANLSRDRGDTEISATLTTALRAALVDEAMGVVPLSATEGAGALAAAEASAAQWLVGGGYQRVGNQLRITARVLGVADGDLVGSVKVDGTLDALDQLTDQMITAVRTELGGAADPAPRPSRDPDTSVGVALALFANISRNPADEQLGQDLKTALTNGLQQLERVSIVPIEAPDDTAALNAASDQRATWLITGGYQRVADQLRVTAHLLDVETGNFVQTVKVDGTLDSVVALQERVQAALEDAVRDALSASDTPDTAAAHGADARTDRTLGQDS